MTRSKGPRVQGSKGPGVGSKGPKVGSKGPKVLWPLRGLGALTWLEIKIFMREPLGVIGSVFVPVLVFLVIGRTFGGQMTGAAPGERGLVGVDLAVFAALLMSISAVLSLVTIISIYREGGILKRLRATPLRPLTILTAHVLVKLLFTAITVGGVREISTEISAKGVAPWAVPPGGFKPKVSGFRPQAGRYSFRRGRFAKVSYGVRRTRTR